GNVGAVWNSWQWVQPCGRWGQDV
ncbi:unnamed protein product, partial [Allacma fusca]